MILSFASKYSWNTDPAVWVMEDRDTLIHGNCVDGLVNNAFFLKTGLFDDLISSGKRQTS